MEKEANILVNPEKVKYCLGAKNRWVVTPPVNGKRWLRSHLVYAFHRKLTLEVMQSLLDLGYVIHHKDNIPGNDSMENLELLKNGKHISLHNKGRKYPHRPSRRPDVKDKDIIDLVVRRNFTLSMAGKTLRASLSLIRDRLLSTGYRNYGSKKSIWIKGDINIPWGEKDPAILKRLKIHPAVGKIYQGASPHRLFVRELKKLLLETQLEE